MSGFFYDVFGGGTLAPADVAYRAVALSADVTLVWPPLSTSPTDFVARLMEVTPSTTGLDITMPPANQVSPGFDVLYSNLGSQTYTVLDNSGGTIATVAAGKYVYLYLTDNTTVAGSWNSFVYGVGTSSISAASLQGFGVTAISTTLNASSDVVEISTDYTIVTNDRASTLVWTGGAGTFTLPLAADALQGFFVEMRNAGTGALVLTADGSDSVDGSPTITLQPTDSLIIHSNEGADWYSVGRGRSTQFNFSQLVKPVTGGTITLTNIEAENNIQYYTGVLTSNQIIVVPGTVQVYYVSNQTTGSYSLTFESPTPGNVVSVPQGMNAILVSDGTNIINASNTVTGISNLTLNAGTAANPSLNFSGDTNTGLYLATTHAMGFAANGVEVGRTTANGFAAINGTAALPSVAFINSPSSGLYSPTTNQVAISQNGVVALTISGSQQVTIPNANISGGVIQSATKILQTVRAVRTSNTIITAANSNYLIDITSGTFSQTFDAAATLASGWSVNVRNSGTGYVTIDPNGAETCDGLTTFIMYPGEERRFTTDGVNLFSEVITPAYLVLTTTTAVIIPPGYLAYDVEAISGGGGGGGGEGRNAGGARQGGTGGGGGARVKQTVSGIAAGTSVTCTIGAGGNSGAGGSGAAGANGTAGGNTTFGTYLTAYGGGRGAGGDRDGSDLSGGGGGGSGSAGYNGVAGTAAGGAPFSLYFGGATSFPGVGTGGGASPAGTATCGGAEFGGGAGAGSPVNGAVGGGDGGRSIFGGGGGGAGGGVTSGNTEAVGGAGGATKTYPNGGGGAAGAVNGGAGGAGAAGSNGDCGQGGGGGGSQDTGTGGVGGAGGAPGGGGGGAGAGTTTGGAGGAGGRGEMRIAFK